MDAVGRWIYLDGPVPDRVRPLLEALRAVPDPSPEDHARVRRAFYERLDATLVTRRRLAVNDEADAAPTPPVTGPARRPSSRPPTALAAVPSSAQDSTLRSPTLADHREAPPPSTPPGHRGAPPLSTPPGLPHAPAAGEGGPSRSSVPVAGAAAPAAPPPEIPSSTGLSVEIPREVRERMSKLPFLRPEEVPPEKKAARTMKVPLWRPRLGETAPAGDDAIRRAVASLPFVASVPRLTLDELASLSAELSVYPGAVDAIRRKYRVDGEGTHRALSLHWQRVFARSPELHARFQARLEEFTAWLRSRAAASAV